MLPINGNFVFFNGQPDIQTGPAQGNNPFVYPEPALGIIPFPGLGNPALIATLVLVGQAARQGAQEFGKQVLISVGVGKAIQKIDEFLDSESQQQQRLLNQLGNDLLRDHVLGLMKNTQQALIDPGITIDEKMQVFRQNHDMVLELIAGDVGSQPHLTSEQRAFVQWSVEQTEKAIQNVGQYCSYLLSYPPQTDEERDNVSNQIAEQVDQIKKVTAGLDFIEETVVGASHSVQKAVQIHQQEQNKDLALIKMREHLAIAQSTFAFAGFVAQLCGNDQLAQQIGQGGQAITSVALAAMSITQLGAGAALSAVFPHYVAIAVAIHSLISLFVNQQKQEQSALASIMEQLKILSKQIKQLHIDLHLHFHELISLLHVHHFEVMVEFAGLVENNQVNAQQMKELKQKMDNNSLKILKYAQEIYIQNFQDQLSVLKHYEVMYGISPPLNIPKLLNAAETFYLWAVESSKKSSLLTDSISSLGAVQQISYSDVSLNLEQVPLEGNIQFLTKYAAIPELPQDPINSFEWMRASNAYLHLRNMFPLFTQYDPEGGAIKNMIACGNERLTLSRQLQKNSPFFETLCQNYKKAIHSCQTTIQAASFESIEIPIHKWGQKLTLLAKSLQHEKEGNIYAQSQIAKYKQQSGSGGLAKMKKLALDYNQYIIKLQERLVFCESTFLSMNAENFPKFLETPCTLDLSHSPSLITFLEGLPLDLHGLFPIPQEAFVAELLGLGHLDIDIKVVEVEKKLEAPKIDESPIEAQSPIKKGNYLKSKRRFEINVKFKLASGQSFMLLAAKTTPLFFPGYQWIRRVIKDSSKPPSHSHVDEGGVLPKKWGHKENENDYVKWFGEVGGAVRAFSAAYLLTNFEYVKEKKLFVLEAQPNASQSLKHEIDLFQKKLGENLVKAVDFPLTLTNKHFSDSVTHLDATQKLLKAYCSLAFPQSVTSDLACIHALSYPKELWTRQEMQYKLQLLTYSHALQQLRNLSDVTDAFAEHLKKKIITFQKQGKFEFDLDVNNMILRLQAYQSEKYGNPQ